MPGKRTDGNIRLGQAFADGASADPGAAYLYQRNQGGADSWGQVEKLTASDAGAGDYFGRSVGISGATIIIGAYGANSGGTDRGAAYFFGPQPYRIYLPLTRNN